MSLQNRLSKHSVLIISLALFLLALAARSLPGARTIDDAFITFRYSRNIAAGMGFVYNAGVHSLGTTTPLFTLLMAVISAVTGGQNFPQYAIIVNALADAGTCVLLFLLARRLTGRNWLAAIPGMLWAISPTSVTFAIGGMETSVNIFWIVAATSIFVLRPSYLSLSTQPSVPSTRYSVLLGIIAGLGILTRIDSALWIAPLFLYQLYESWRATAGQPFLRRFPWATWFAFGLTILPWFAFSLSYFGFLFPNSVAAKTIAYHLPPGSALFELIQTYSTPFFDYRLIGPVAGVALGGILYLLLSVIGILYVARRQSRLLPFLLYPWIYFLAFSIANPLIFRWYVAPPVPALMFGIFTGLWALADNVRQRSESNTLPRWAVPVISAFAVFWVVASLGGWELHPDHAPDRPAPIMAWHKIELLYEDMGTMLRYEYGVTPDTLVASGDIGAVGYFSNATILDTVGLVTPALSHYYPVPDDLIPEGQNYAIPPQMILDLKPQFLVAMESMVRLGLEQNAEFKSDYELIRQIPTDFYGTGMYLYRRRAGL